MQVAANFAASIFLMSKLDFHFHSSFCVGCKIVISVCVCFFFTPAPFAAAAAVENALSGAGIYPLFIHSLSTLYPSRATIKCYCCLHLRPIWSNKTMHLFMFGFKIEHICGWTNYDWFKKKRQATIQCYCNNQVFTGIRVFAALPSFRLIFRFPNKLPVYWLSARATRPELLKDKVKRLLGATSSIHFRGGTSKTDTLLKF